ncbi:hypothetical protein FDECE_5555 [Fusarium decemcellulare]|nr:hypothetical protein FDECE_5555 [Fusarium decemcellulare]
MRSEIICSLLLAAFVNADFAVWKLQESVVGSGSDVYPLVTPPDVQSGAQVYEWWDNHPHWYDLECDGCGFGDGYDQSGGILYIGESSQDQGFRLKFTGLPDGEGKDACSQLLGIRCDYQITREDGSDVGGCEFGGHSLVFTENTMGVLAHIDGFRSLYCISQQVSF